MIAIEDNGIPLRQLRDIVVVPALMQVSLYSPEAVNLVTGTALAESAARYLRQVLNGGAYGAAWGLWQMEAATHDDCWSNFLNFRPDMQKKVLALLAPSPSRVQQLASNLQYAAAMARIRYYRAWAPLPRADDAAGLSAYHKQFYNTAAGAADPVKNIPFFQAAIDL